MNRLVLTLMTAAIGLGIASRVSARDQELTPEDFTKLRELFKQGQTYSADKEYGKSNQSYQEILKRLPEADLDINRAFVLFNMGANYALLGEREKAFETLAQAVSTGFWDADALRSAPDLASLRSASEFDALLKKAQAGLASMAFGLKDLKGKELKKEDFEGKVLVIDVWGTWCPPCRMEIPHFVKLQKQYGKEGFAVIGLTWEQREPDKSVVERVARFASQNDVNYPLVMATQSRLNLIPDLGGYPTTFFVGRDGTVRDRVSGYHPYEDLRARVTRLLKEKAPTKVAAGD